jgi:hypothetical protein
MDPFTLHVLASHTDVNTTKRYVDPGDADLREAMEQALSAVQRPALQGTHNLWKQRV